MSAKAGKRPLRSLSAHEKLEAIRRVHEGESKASVARDIGVPESTLRGWCKNEDKISYLSRQSSPETDEASPLTPLGFETKEKKVKLNDLSCEPYNLSMKSSTVEQQQVLNLSDTKTQISERERNRAELARLSVALGLNRPEMFFPNMNNGTNATNNISEMNLIAQYNQILLQTPNKYQTVTSTSQSQTQTPVKSQRTEKPPAATLDDPVWYWLKGQNATNSNTSPLNNSTISQSCSSSTTNTTYNNNTIDSTNADQSSSWFWKWYKQYASAYPTQQQVPDENPILYQQLMKDKDRHDLENIRNGNTSTTSSKARAVLDNLLLNNNNNNLSIKADVEDHHAEVVSSDEALLHGEKFLEWLECCSEPSVTTLQIMQFRYLLNNIKSGVDRKNNEAPESRAKVRRK